MVILNRHSNKKVKISILILVFILTCFLLYKFFPFFLVKFKPNDLPEEALTGVNLTEESLEDLNFSLPVDEKYFEKAILDGDNNKFIFFNLDPGSSVKSLFAGEVIDILIKQKPFSIDLGDDVEVNTIIIKDKDEKFLANYTFSGIVLVNNGDEIGALSVLGEVDEQKMKFHDGTNLFLWITDSQYKPISLSKEIFK